MVGRARRQARPQSEGHRREHPAEQPGQRDEDERLAPPEEAPVLSRRDRRARAARGDPEPEGESVRHGERAGGDRAERGQRRELPRRFEREASNLASLTGWDMNKIRGRMNLKAGGPPAEDEPWWKEIWKD